MIINGNCNNITINNNQDPPDRPIPPPPREANLGHTLGKRIKLLRRTWSITKGSLGRMRRRASNDSEICLMQSAPTSLSQQQSYSNDNNTDVKKYFSFKKHFRNKNQSIAVGGLSTFYLDKTESGRSKEQEPIYANGNPLRYQEAGLYKNKTVDKLRAEFESRCNNSNNNKNHQDEAAEGIYIYVNNYKLAK